MELSLLTIGIGLAVASLELIIGMGLGWWLRGGSNAPPTPPEDSERARNALQKLHELASRMAADVGEHNSRVQAISEGLTSMHGDVDAVVLKQVTDIIEANDRLQQQLASAENRLQQQAHEIRVHAADALTDALTGASNRRAFDRQLAALVEAWNTQKVPFSLLMVDVDHFKRFNDTHGHQAGDEVLRHVAQLLHRLVGVIDVVARYGGEEFAILLPGSNAQAAEPIALRINEAIARSNFNVQGQTLRVTVSEGLAHAMASESVEAIIRRADEALYASKKGGRNQAHRHDGKATFRIEAPRVEKPAPAPAVEAETAMVRTDSVTGLPNRTAFFEEVRRRFAVSQKYSSYLTLMIFRIDEFNVMLEAKGEALQEPLLRMVSQFLTTGSREVDLVARYEDDSFGVVLPGMEMEEALDVAERLRAAIARCPLRLRDQELRFTVSVGLSTIKNDAEPTTLIRRAMAAVEGSQEAGGDHVSFHDGDQSRTLAGTAA